MPLVSVITRTKDRPILLKRACESISGQTVRDLEWIVVNDGGDAAPVDEIVESIGEKKVTSTVIHNEKSMGMESASNIGINRASGKYIVIHDDDDSWESAFLARTTGFLQSGDNYHYAGVVTRSWMIHEEISGDTVKIKKKTPHNPGLSSITLFQMAQLRNVPPPISFLYKREVYEKTGLYREDLPVLGDWEFNLRFLRFFDIGLITDRLANYHVRIGRNKSVYSNTITDGIDLHVQYAAKLRNEYLRKDLEDNNLGLGYIINLCHEIEQVKKDVNRANLVLKLKNLIKALR